MKLRFLLNPKTIKQECRVGKTGTLFIKVGLVECFKFKEGERFELGINAEDPEDKAIYMQRSESNKGSKLHFNNHSWIMSVKYVFNELNLKYPCYVKLEEYKDEQTTAIKITVL